jgi:RHS repeat-associated protein
LFAGEQRDFNVGLDYLRARYLNVVTERFYGMDPDPGNVVFPMTKNKYLYATLNPVSNIDPTGRFTLVEALASTVIVSVLAQNLFGSLASFAGIYNGRLDVEWKGEIYSATASLADNEQMATGASIVAVKSNCVNGRRTEGAWLLLGAGYSRSITEEEFGFDASIDLKALLEGDISGGGSVSGIGVSHSPIVIDSPSFFGTKVAALSGTFMSVGLSAGFGPAGVSFSSLTMGFGRAKLDSSNMYGFSNATGFTLGYSLIAGLSIPVYWNTSNC